MSQPATSDDFSSATLGLQWQWNHNPDDTRWSLADRPGYLRLRPTAATDFWTAYRRTALAADELLLRVRLPVRLDHQVRFRKVGTRRAQAISKVVMALAWREDGGVWRDVRLALGSVAPTPIRAAETESVLEGAAPRRTTADHAASTLRSELRPIDDVRSTAAYRSAVAGRVLHRLLREAGRRSDAHLQRYAAAANLVRPNDTVLDVACGLGYGVAMMAATGRASRLIGIDNSAYAIDYAQTMYGAAGAQIHFRHGDAHDLTHIADHSIDLVVSFETVEHLADPRAFLEHVARVLKPGGRVIGSVPNGRRVLEASQHVIVPLQAEPLALQTTPQILRAIQDVVRVNEELTLDGILLTMFEAGNPANERTAQYVRRHLPTNMVFDITVPRTPAAADAFAGGQPVVLRDPGDAASQAYVNLATVLADRFR